MSDYGIKISKPGFDVKTTDKSNLIMDSEANSLKIYTTGSIQFNQTGNVAPTVQTVAHGLGYIPFVLCFWKSTIDSSKYYFQDSNDDSSEVSGVFANVSQTVDSTNINIQANLSGTGNTYTFTVYYTILIDKSYE